MEKIIPINITKGHLTRISLDFKDKDNVVEVAATIELKSEQGEKITEICLSTTAWNANQKIEMPVDVVPLASRIREIAEHSCIEKINGRFAEITG